YSPDGKYLYTATYYGEVKKWDADTAEELGTLARSQTVPHAVAFSANAERCAAFAPSNLVTVRVLSLAGGKEVCTLAGNDAAGRKEPVRELAFSADGRQLVGTANNRLILWDADTGAEVRTLLPPAKGFRLIHGTCFSPDGRHVAAGVTERPKFDVLVW